MKVYKSEEGGSVGSLDLIVEFKSKFLKVFYDESKGRQVYSYLSIPEKEVSIGEVKQLVDEIAFEELGKVGYSEYPWHPEYPWHSQVSGSSLLLTLNKEVSNKAKMAVENSLKEALQGGFKVPVPKKNVFVEMVGPEAGAIFEIDEDREDNDRKVEVPILHRECQSVYWYNENVHCSVDKKLDSKEAMTILLNQGNELSLIKDFHRVITKVEMEKLVATDLFLEMQKLI